MSWLQQGFIFHKNGNYHSQKNGENRPANHRDPPTENCGGYSDKQAEKEAAYHGRFCVGLSVV